MKTTLALLSVIAVVFGVATIFAGGRVLAGADPGYEVFRPLVVFNTLMGFAYMATGVLMWRSVERGRIAAFLIFVLNTFAWAVVILLYRLDLGVAVESVRAMALRTVVWLLLAMGAAWVVRRGSRRA